MYNIIYSAQIFDAAKYVVVHIVEILQSLPYM